MELVPKLVAAADMCAEGEDVNLDELAFLLRYSVDELQKQEVLKGEHETLISRERDRVLARVDLLNCPLSEKEIAEQGPLEELVALSNRLDADFRNLYKNPENGLNEEGVSEPFPSEQYNSGR